MAHSDPNPARPDPEHIAAVDRNLRERRTRKILAGAGDAEQEQQFLQGLRESIALAGAAPFHFPRQNELPEPWRFHIFHGDAYARVTARLTAADLLYGKLPKIFSHAGAVIVATWLPETDPALQARNWEHSVASGAAIQNLLLAAEARGIGSYWCSAPNLATAEAMEIWGAAEGEQLLGALFMGWPLSAEDEAASGWSGKMRDRRTSPESGWCRWAE